MSAIPLAVSRKTPAPRAKDVRLVTAEYGRALREGARRAGLGWEEAAAAAGVSPVTAWRVENDQGSLKAAEALRAVLATRATRPTKRYEA